MTKLNDIEILEQYIDNTYIPNELLFLKNQPKNITVLNLLRYLEYLHLDYKIKGNLVTHQDTNHQLIGLNFSLKKWAEKWCETRDVNNFEFVFDKVYLKKLEKIFGLSQKYSYIDNWFFYFKKGILFADLQNNEKKVIIASRDRDDQLFKIINSAVGSPHVEKGPNEDRLNNIEKVVKMIANFLAKNVITNKKFYRYNFNSEDIKPIYTQFYDSYGIILWSLNETWSLGQYSVKEFREVIAGILTISHIHNAWCSLLMSKQMTDHLFNNLVLFFSREKWIKIIQTITNVDKKVIEQIIDQLTYKHSDDQTRRKIGFTLDIFFEIGNGILAMSHTTARNSNIERNIWLLLARKEEQLHSSLSIEKEKYWLSTIIPKLNRNDLVVRADIDIKNKTNIDLLLIDYKSKIGLTIELKWLTPPNRALEYCDQDSIIYKELKKGQSQALICANWANSNKELLAEKISISSRDIQGVNFKGLVLSKNLIGAAALHKENGVPPIISEELFWWILDKPHYKDISILYKIATEKRFYPKQDKHYKKIKLELDFAGYKFTQKDQYVPTDTQWNPNEDIEI